jgi:hypothetical protein
MRLLAGFKGAGKLKYLSLQQSRVVQRRVEKRSKRCTETASSYMRTRYYTPYRGPSTKISLHTCPSSSRRAPKRKDQLQDRPQQRRAKGLTSSQHGRSRVFLLKNIAAGQRFLRRMRFGLVSYGTVKPAVPIQRHSAMLAGSR